jgi:hypothetical protein
MKLSESYKRRIMKLSGARIDEDVTLTASQGRSDSGTLSWYAEEYLLNLGSSTLTALDDAVKKELGMKLAMSKSFTKMVSNSLVTKLFVQKEGESGANEGYEFLLSLNVNFEQGGNTSSTITYKGTTDALNLNSKHSGDDLSIFITEIINHILNIVRRESK